MTTLRAGLIGVGVMGRNHLRVLSSLDGVDLVGVVDPEGELPKLHRSTPLLRDLKALLERGVDMAVVAAPTAAHLHIGLRLADAGVHTLFEKPLASTLADAHRLVSTFARAGLVGAVGHIERYNPATRELRRRLDAGELGEVFQVTTSRQGPYPNRIRDVGVVLDLATHDVDLTAWLLGEGYGAVAARVAHRTGRDHEDVLAATAVTEGGIVVNHLVNWLTPTKERQVRVTGERGMLVADTLTAALTRYENGTVPLEWDAVRTMQGVSEGDVTRYAIAKREPLLVELEVFRDAVRGEGEPGVVTLKDGLGAIAVAEAMLVSARDGTTVSVGGVA